MFMVGVSFQRGGVPDVRAIGGRGQWRRKREERGQEMGRQKNGEFKGLMSRTCRFVHAAEPTSQASLPPPSHGPCTLQQGCRTTVHLWLQNNQRYNYEQGHEGTRKATKYQDDTPREPDGCVPLKETAETTHHKQPPPTRNGHRTRRQPCRTQRPG